MRVCVGSIGQFPHVGLLRVRVEPWTRSIRHPPPGGMVPSKAALCSFEDRLEKVVKLALGVGIGQDSKPA
jgi:hypothetical protein